MHIFLTGEKQVGKSTLIRKVLESLRISPSGFVTRFEIISSREKHLYLHHPLKDPQEDQCVAKIIDKQREVYPFVFDVVGTALLKESKGPLILMDECGEMESKSPAFQQAVRKTLDEDIPVLGVIKAPGHGWLKELKEHPKVKVYEVTRENRDLLFHQILAYVKENIQNYKNPF